ncbi:MAG TPA: NADH-quinone oxidoreductase subunit H [Candidatus Obscuribacterales bacterium]
MQEQIINIVVSVLSILIVPPLLIGTIRKTKARLQNRIGAPLWQPFIDMTKLFRKDETISKTASWAFRFSAATAMAISVYLAVTSPWTAPQLRLGPCDLFLFLYLLAAFRFLTLLLALDTSSPFGTFAASREATLSFLVEPAAVLSLAALAVAAHTSDLNLIFGAGAPHNGMLWVISGSAFLLAGLVDLSRMPIDDPTTHLELTMVHEALILEASGKNLALLEGATWLKFAVLLGVSAQCFLHAFPRLYANGSVVEAAASITMLLLLAVSLGTFESLTVKLHWRKAPEFIAYALTLAFIASIVALGAGAV